MTIRKVKGGIAIFDNGRRSAFFSHLYLREMRKMANRPDIKAGAKKVEHMLRRAGYFK